MNKNRNRALSLVPSELADVETIRLGEIILDRNVVRIEFFINRTYTSWHDEWVTMGEYDLDTGYGYMLMPNGKRKEYKQLKSFLLSAYKHKSDLFYEDIYKGLNYKKEYKNALKSA